MFEPESNRSLSAVPGVQGAGKFPGLRNGNGNGKKPGHLVMRAFLLFALALPCWAQAGPGRLSVAPLNRAITVGSNLQLTANFAFLGNRTGGADVTNQIAWQSSDTNIATVSNTGLVSANSSNRGTVTITAIRRPFRTSTTVTVIPNTALLSLTVMPTNPSIPKGLQQQFTATGGFAGGINQNVTASSTWTSLNLNVASVASAGLIRGRNQGTATIVASFGGLNDSTTLTVTPPILQSVVVVPANPSIPLGTNQQFSAIGILSDGSTQNLTNSSAWATSNPSVATVNSAGLATSRAQGSTTISATFSSFTGPTLLTVAPPALISIAITPVNPSVHPGTSLQLTAFGTFTDGSMQNLTSVAFWSSSNGAVASVNGTGLVSAASAGTATITAAGSGFMGSLITGSTIVSVPALLSISIAPPNPTIAQGNSLQLTATGSYSDGSTLDLTNSVAWTSSNPAVVPVSTTGLIMGNRAGFGIIRATQGTVTGSTSALIGFSALSLNGRYAFSFNGVDHDGPFLEAGSFRADGNGNLLNGVEDFNGGTGVLPNLGFTGSYTVGIDGRGSASLTTGEHLKFVLTAPGSAVIIEFDNFAVASGSIAQQDPGAFFNLQGNFAFQLSGVSTAGLIANVGQFSADGAGHISNGQRDVNDSGTASSGTFTGSYTAVASNGRGTLTFNNSDGSTSRYSYYIVAGDRFNLVSLDFVPAFLGVAHLRSSSTFSNGSVAGFYVFSESGFTSTDQFRTNASLFSAAGVFFANGSGSLSNGRQDLNDGGSVLENTGVSGTYNVASNGRGTATIDGFPYVLYIVSPSLVYFMNTDAGAVLTRTIQSQPAIIFSTSSFQGNFNLLLSGRDLVSRGTLAISGQMFADGSGTLNGTEDVNDNQTLSANVGLNGNYSVEADGRGSGTINGPNGALTLHFYMISFDSAVFVETDRNNVQIGSAQVQF